MRIALIPLDERPVNTRYPQMIAEIAGMSVGVPPAELLSHQRQPASSVAQMEWLHTQAAGLDVLIVSLEMLAYGGLIASRITDAHAPVLFHRLDALRTLKQQHPALQLYGFNLVTRIPNANDSVEEPDYWAQYGTQIHRYSAAMHRAQFGDSAAEAEADALSDLIPEEAIADFTRRRLRNHTVNLYALDLLADGVLDHLVLSSDDTSPYGYGTQEKAWLQTWSWRLSSVRPRLLMYPGADEVGCVLLARALLSAHETVPHFYVHYALDADRDRIAPYEDGPVSVTVERQIAALGGVIVNSTNEADYVLAVNPPSPLSREFDLAATESERAYRQAAVTAQVAQIATWLDADKAVIVADVAYPNGSDPVLIEALLAGLDLRRLAAYGAWNTAGNTIGVALAQGVAAAQVGNDPVRQQAQQRFLLHRFLEDWGYQHLVRDMLREHLRTVHGVPDVTSVLEDSARAFIARELNLRLAELGALGQGWRIVPDSVRLPWHRSFEVDFDLEHGGE